MILKNLVDIILLILKVIIVTHLFKRHLFSSHCVAGSGLGTENAMLNEHISESEGCLQPK